MSQKIIIDLVSGKPLLTKEATQSEGLTYDVNVQHDFIINASLGTGGVSANRFESQPLDIMGNVTIQSATIEVTSAGTGVGLVGIYNVDENGVQNELLAATPTEYDLTIVGEQTISFTTPLKLTTGRYALVFSRNNVGGGPVMRVVKSRRVPWGVSGTSILVRSVVNRLYDGTLPATAPAPNYFTGATPYIKFNLS
jgi:hypothetical protein